MLQPFKYKILCCLLLTISLPTLAQTTRHTKTKAVTEYEILRQFPAGYLQALFANDKPDAQGLTGTNRLNGSWLEAGPQRGGCRGVAIAVVLGDLARADEAWRVIDVAFAHQKEDGSFEANIRPNGASAKSPSASVETSYFFLQELARTVLLIRQSPHEAYFQQRIAVIEPKMRKAIAYVAAGYDTIIASSSHAVNRIILAAKAFGLCGLALHDQTLIASAKKLIAHALTLRDSAGVFIEKGGRDSSYNVVSILYGQILALYVPLPEFEAALPAAVAWQLTRVMENGEIDVTGNTRTGVGTEKSYFGTPKNVNYNEVILALTYYGVVHKDKAVLAAADKVFTYAHKKVQPK